MPTAGVQLYLRGRLMSGEPNPVRATNLSIGAAAVAAVNAFVALLVSFGLSISAQQEASIGAVVNSVIILLVALSHVYGQKTVEQEHVANNGKIAVPAPTDPITPANGSA